MSNKIITQCNTKLAIPMQGQVESLNVATSAAIFLYEKSKNTRYIS
ncbi:MAG: TrmH family RNA methyltransferase [Candidatus Riflebacteria bacterium]|nr:TrmH family RNA methyltransferase [Candidatus Riflebacteria bacterium]